MGQLLLVQGEDPEAQRTLYRRACELFRRFYGVAPSHHSEVGSTALARFQPLHTRTEGYLRQGEAWAASAGTWVHTSSSRPDGLAELAHAFKTGADLGSIARRFDGYFFLAAGRDSSPEAVVITDRLGALHAYHATVGSCLVVSTSALVLAALRGSALDPVAAREILCTDQLFEERSLFEGVEKLAAGSVYRLQEGRILSSVRWFDLRSTLYGISPSTGDVPELAEALLESVRAIFRSCSKPVLDLTGGIDSRNVLAAARRTGRGFATVVNGDDHDPDVILANRIAHELKLDHRQQAPGRDYRCSSFEDLQRASVLCDGEFNAVEYAPAAAIQECTAEGFDLSVSGTYGENCHANVWHRLASREGLDIRKFIRLRFESPWVDRLTRGRFPDSSAEHFRGMFLRTVEGLANVPVTTRLNYAEAVHRSRWAGRVASATLRIRPCIAPFGFERFLHVSLSALPASRVDSRMPLALLQDLDPELAAVPLVGSVASQPHPLQGLRRGIVKAALSTGGRFWGALPSSLYPNKLYSALSALDLWSMPEVWDLLSPGSMLTRDLYDPVFLRSFLTTCRKRRWNPASMLGRVLSLELASWSLRNLPGLPSREDHLCGIALDDRSFGDAA